jgi:hypothetical protein
MGHTSKNLLRASEDKVAQYVLIANVFEFLSTGAFHATQLQKNTSDFCLGLDGLSGPHGVR